MLPNAGYNQGIPFSWCLSSAGQHAGPDMVAWAVCVRESSGAWEEEERGLVRDNLWPRKMFNRLARAQSNNTCRVSIVSKTGADRSVTMPLSPARCLDDQAMRC